MKEDHWQYTLVVLCPKAWCSSNHPDNLRVHKRSGTSPKSNDRHRAGGISLLLDNLDPLRYKGYFISSQDQGMQTGISKTHLGHETFVVYPSMAGLLGRDLQLFWGASCAYSQDQAVQVYSKAPSRWLLLVSFLLKRTTWCITFGKVLQSWPFSLHRIQNRNGGSPGRHIEKDRGNDDPPRLLTKYL